MNKTRGRLLKDVPVEEIAPALDYAQDALNTTLDVDINDGLKKWIQPNPVYLKYASKEQVEEFACLLKHEKRELPIPMGKYRTIYLFNMRIIQTALKFMVGENAHKYYTPCRIQDTRKFDGE